MFRLSFAFNILQSVSTMPKRSLSSTSVNGVDNKRPKTTNLKFTPNKVASHDAAAAVDADPPLPKLLKAVEDGVKNPAKGESVVYWMRMGDLRSKNALVLSDKLNTTLICLRSFFQSHRQ